MAWKKIFSQYNDSETHRAENRNTSNVRIRKVNNIHFRCFFSCIHLIFLINPIIPSSSYHKSTLELKFTIIALKKKKKKKKIPTPGITYPIHIDDIQRRPVSKANHHRPTPPPPTDHSTFHKEC